MKVDGVGDIDLVDGDVGSGGQEVVDAPADDANQ